MRENWQAYQVILRLHSPLHIGWGRISYLQRTRPYVTGRTLWGALTARLTRDYPGLGSDYQAVGKQVDDQLAFSYFFPSTEKDVHKVPFFPWDDTDEFAWRYLNTYASTTLDYCRNAALEGSLHETEYIAPLTRRGEAVYLIGFIFEKNGCSLKWKDALDRLQLGGERTYGWGRVQLLEKKELQPPCPFWPGWEVNLQGKRPSLQRKHSSARAYAHVQVNGVEARGTLEPVVGRETQAADRHGEALSQATLCWAPGSEVQAPATFEIDAHGIWKASQNQAQH